MTKCAYRFGAPDAMMMVRTATSVLHDARVLDTLRRSEPCGIGRSFWGASHIAVKRHVPASWQREKGGQQVSTDSDVPLD